jgi:hypothetical protein
MADKPTTPPRPTLALVTVDAKPATLPAGVRVPNFGEVLSAILERFGSVHFHHNGSRYVPPEERVSASVSVEGGSYISVSGRDARHATAKLAAALGKLSR